MNTFSKSTYRVVYIGIGMGLLRAWTNMVNYLVLSSQLW